METETETATETATVKPTDDRMVLLIAGDSTQKLRCRRAAIVKAKLVREMLDDDDDPGEIEVPLPNVSNDVLVKVIEYMEYHENNPPLKVKEPIHTNILSKLVGEWDAKFMDFENLEMVSKLILAANYIDLDGLLMLGITRLACVIKGKTPKQLTTLFNIRDDITPAEEKEVRDKNDWLFARNLQKSKEVREKKDNEANEQPAEPQQEDAAAVADEEGEEDEDEDNEDDQEEE
jgi:S-phase kinase-associated protein 1